MLAKTNNYLLKIEYDGTKFVGWQYQKNGISVQEKIEKALSKIEREQKPKSPENKKEEKENRGFKKLLKEKLLKFITRVPAFMYLTDFREESLRDVITQLEQDLFKKVTGLEIKDFEELCNIGVFNYQLMDSAIYNFRKYEEASLNYVGGGTLPSRIGLFESTISSFEEL